MTNTNVDRLVEEFDRKFANATYSPDGRGGVECHCHEMKDWLRSALSQARQEVAEEILAECQKDVDFGAQHQQMVSTCGQAKCLEIIRQSALTTEGK